jgi:exopolyphosphatase/guanosine-5'-triphosphate,3'-diphosphate pyrophosphatase
MAALDIGTNSFHLVVARPTGTDGFEVLTREKEVVRLGRGGGDMKLLAPDAVERGVACLQRMRRIADSHGAPVRAVATSATREALNARQFIDRARTDAGIEIEVISGVEEARLIHLGVLQAVPVFDQRILVVDIGGGSTELVIGERGETLAARSLKLGAVRLTDRYFPGGVTSGKSVRAARDDLRLALTHFAHEAGALGFDTAVVSSGTAESLARVIHAATGAEALRTYNCFQFTTDELSAAVAGLAGHRRPEVRARTKGLEPGRADIIVAGGLILESIAVNFGVGAFTYSEAALREGVLLDTLSRTDGAGTGELHHLRDVSRRSIRQLAERCDDDPAHSAHVAQLALELFDGLAPAHGLDGAARDYLEAGALLANVGLVVAHSKHHLHAYYVIRNSELAGLTDAEIEIIAQIARYHRKSEPKPSHVPFAALPRSSQALVRTLAAILRVAIGLDRTHEGRVTGLRVELGPKAVVVRAGGDGDVDTSLEVYAANERKGLLEAVLDRPVQVVSDAG